MGSKRDTHGSKRYNKYLKIYKCLAFICKMKKKIGTNIQTQPRNHSLSQFVGTTNHVLTINTFYQTADYAYVWGGAKLSNASLSVDSKEIIKPLLTLFFCFSGG